MLLIATAVFFRLLTPPLAGHATNHLRTTAVAIYSLFVANSPSIERQAIPKLPSKLKSKGLDMGQQQTETITVRKDLNFGFETDDIPRYWMAGDAFKTRLIDAVQATFPDGERYFIASVRAFREGIKDPAQLQEVRDFMMQEGQHGMVHSAYNQRLQRQGIHIEGFTRHTKAICDRRLKHLSAEYNVALTAALEHFTAMMADLFFAKKSVLAGADERVRAMLAWHAVEEMPIRVTTGNMAFFSAWRTRMTFSTNPLARAVRM